MPRNSVQAIVPPGLNVETSVSYYEPDQKNGLVDVTIRVRASLPQTTLALLELTGPIWPVEGMSFDIGDERADELATTAPARRPDRQGDGGKRKVYLLPLPAETFDEEEGGSFSSYVSLAMQLHGQVSFRDNSRVVVHTPVVYPAGSCRALGSAWLNGRTDDEIEEWWATTDGQECDSVPGDLTTPGRRLQEIELSKLLPSDIRVDYVNPAPTPVNPQSWQSVDRIAVDANYVLISEEAQGQRNLFISGVLLGVLTALFPAGFKLLSTGIRLGRRRHKLQCRTARPLVAHLRMARRGIAPQYPRPGSQGSR
jgi:hypothetical protein